MLPGELKQPRVRGGGEPEVARAAPALLATGAGARRGTGGVVVPFAVALEELERVGHDLTRRRGLATDLSPSAIIQLTWGHTGPSQYLRGSNRGSLGAVEGTR